ncbi:MAG: aldehyde dehydrogenase family protein [Chthoniobacterales bacterium]
MRHWNLYVDGQWLEGDTEKTILSPYDQKPFAAVQLAGPAQVEKCLASAATAARLSHKTHERSAWLEAIRNGIQERLEEFAQTICEEAGKPIAIARTEAERAVNTFDLAAKLVSSIEQEWYPLDVIKSGEGRQCLTARFPVGPVLAITPYNWPLNLGAHKIAPALAVGCPVIVRPATQTPCSSLLIAEIIDAIGIPAGMFQVLPCVPALAEKMALDDRIKMISFTGSPEVGWSLKQKGSNKRVSLELGGNAACILEPETDLDFAVPRLAAGCFGYAGQVCISVQRILVHESIRAEFDRRMLHHMATDFKTGNPRDEKTVCGPLITAEAAEKVLSWINEAVDQGARILCGGKRIAENMIEPTLVENVRHDLSLSCKEAFGPVATVESYTDFDNALTIANDSQFGINCGVFTNDIKKAWRAFQVLDVGCVIINDYPSYRVDRMPYGGVKQSGFGREGVKYAMEEMTEIKALILNLS